jgi:hypothetical protein
MSPHRLNNRGETIRLLLKLSLATLFAFFATALAAAQDLTLGVTYVCNGERMFIELSLVLQKLSLTYTTMDYRTSWNLYL